MYGCTLKDIEIYDNEFAEKELVRGTQADADKEMAALAEIN